MLKNKPAFPFKSVFFLLCHQWNIYHGTFYADIITPLTFERERERERERGREGGREGRKERKRAGDRGTEVPGLGTRLNSNKWIVDLEYFRLLRHIEKCLVNNHFSLWS